MTTSSSVRTAAHPSPRSRCISPVAISLEPPTCWTLRVRFAPPPSSSAPSVHTRLLFQRAWQVSLSNDDRRECAIECFVRRQGPPAASPISHIPLLLGPLILLTLFNPPSPGRLYKVLNISCYCFTVSYSFILHPSPLHSFSPCSPHPILSPCLVCSGGSLSPSNPPGILLVS